MISSPSRLTSRHKKLVIDASVAINILGTGRASDVLRALNRTVLIEENALREVVRDPFTRKSGHEAMKRLADLGLIFPARLSADAYEVFLGITGASPPDDLDDGEAATIAQALDVDGAPVIDEKKASRIVRGLSKSTPLLHTLDLLSCSEIVCSLSESELSDILYGALRHSRMRVPHSFEAWVLSLVGERTSECPSIKLSALKRTEGFRG